jgi:hypothetical protein
MELESTPSMSPRPAVALHSLIQGNMMMKVAEGAGYIHAHGPALLEEIEEESRE